VYVVVIGLTPLGAEIKQRYLAELQQWSRNPLGWPGRRLRDQCPEGCPIPPRPAGARSQ
jgi:hypothetical protein